MGRINVRVDEDLLDEVDSQGEVRSEVVRDALKQYLGKEEVKQSEAEAELDQVVERVVDRKMEDDIYPRLGNIYDRLEQEMETEEQEAVVDLQVSLDREVYEFYEGYTHAFQTTLDAIASDLLGSEAQELSDELREVSPNDTSWMLETEAQE